MHTMPKIYGMDSEDSKPKAKRKLKKNRKTCHPSKKCQKKLCVLSIFVTILLVATTITATAIEFVATYKKEIFIPTTTVSNNVSLSFGLTVGQACSYDFQCQEKAFCNITCQCPRHYFLNTTSGNCTLQKTNAATCGNDFECDVNIGLKCISSTCQCESLKFWNSTYVVGVALPKGRCQNRKVYGMQCSVSNNCIVGSSCGAYYSTKVEAFEANDTHSNNVATKARKCDFQCSTWKFVFIFIASLTICGIIATVVAFIASYKKSLIVPTTTSSYSNSASYELFVGQACQYNNQCQEKAFCSGTCQCPVHYYQDISSGNCTLRKTNAVACSSDIECNYNIGLKCISSTCQCDSVNFWNSTYVVGTGIPNGRCQNRKVYGMQCSVNTNCIVGSSCGAYYSAQINRCVCNNMYGFKTGTCYQFTSTHQSCEIGNECQNDYEICMDKFGYGIKRCSIIPTYTWFGGYQQKRDINWGSCNYYPCNEWENLVCRITTQTCQCFDKYYYHNGTMCIRGSRYGEKCTAASQCVPGSSMSCSAPFTGATYSVCRCSSSQYYDPVTESCINLRTYNTACRDNSDCIGGIGNSMYCGFYSGGSRARCLCTDSYYSTGGSTCPFKYTRGTYCTSNTQCYGNLNQTCVSNYCGCTTRQYFNSGDSTCRPKKYTRDACSSGTECWSGTCSSSICT